MNSFADLAEKYLALRRNLGFKGDKSRLALRDLLAFLDEEDAEHITTDIVARWAKLPQGCHPNWWAERFSIARNFASYCLAFDPKTEVPPQGLLVHRKHRPSPYIYSDAEISRILEAAKDRSGEQRYPSGLGPPDRFRSVTYPTLYALLSVTGLRAREVVRLDRNDVDLDQGMLRVMNTKFGKSRLVPLHPSSRRALREYVHQRDNVYGVPSGPAFFVFQNGGRVSYGAAYSVFFQLLRRLGIREPGQTRPRLHDLRHSFAVKTLIRWYRAGIDVERRMPILSTYLGHARVGWTYWYLTAVPELLQLARRRLETQWRRG